jgi:hypothetical protein
MPDLKPRSQQGGAHHDACKWHACTTLLLHHPVWAPASVAYSTCGLHPAPPTMLQDRQRLTHDLVCCSDLSRHAASVVHATAEEAITVQAPALLEAYKQLLCAATLHSAISAISTADHVLYWAVLHCTCGTSCCSPHLNVAAVIVAVDIDASC